ncbi:MAG: RidA family protein [Halobacteriota archaeon]
MALERFIPDTVYQTLPRGQPLKDLYSQVIRATGTTTVYLAGTVPADDDGLVGEGDMQTQVRTILDNIERSLAAAGAEPTDVVRITVYTVDVDRYLAEGSSEVIDFFEAGRPTSTLVGVERLAEPEFLVEIEATAVID